jgi:hypothetical protein
MGPDKIVKIIGVLVAVVAGLIGGFPQSVLVVTVLGIAGGWYTATEDRQRLLIAALALLAVHGALGGIPVVGEYLTAALGGLSGLLNAAAATAIILGTIDAVKPAS